MPKYYCDYCDTYLTHDSPSVRKTHCSGRKHKENVKFYYQKWMEDQAQNLIDATIEAYKKGVMKGGAAIPPPNLNIPGMPPRPGGPGPMGGPPGGPMMLGGPMGGPPGGPMMHPMMMGGPMGQRPPMGQMGPMGPMMMGGPGGPPMSMIRPGMPGAGMPGGGMPGGPMPGGGMPPGMGMPGRPQGPQAPGTQPS